MIDEKEIARLRTTARLRAEYAAMVMQAKDARGQQRKIKRELDGVLRERAEEAASMKAAWEAEHARAEVAEKEKAAMFAAWGGCKGHDEGMRRERDEARAANAAMRALIGDIGSLIEFSSNRINDSTEWDNDIELGPRWAVLWDRASATDAGRDILDALAAAEAALRNIQTGCETAYDEQVDAALAKIKKARGGGG